MKNAEKVSILTVETELTDTGAAERLARYLAWHGVKAVIETMAGADRGIGDLILERVKGINADLLVMGAYTHSRMRELILGGVTHDMLDKADFPVLMAH